jgi:hypothetical protein
MAVRYIGFKRPASVVNVVLSTAKKSLSGTALTEDAAPLGFWAG